MVEGIECLAVEQFVCHICWNKFRDYSSLISHFDNVHSKNCTKKKEETAHLPRLNQTDRDMLHSNPFLLLFLPAISPSLVLRLHRCNAKPQPRKPKDRNNSHLSIPLSMESIISSKQTSFDDSICHTTHSLLLNKHPIESEDFSNTLMSKSSSSYHTYKYSRREQKRFYASVARARLKKHNPTSRRIRPLSPIFEQGNYLIILPTIINSRQRLNTNSNNSYPLIFDPNFNSLVQKSTHHLLDNYFVTIESYFQLLHSIASQEFQTIVYSNDTHHQVSYTAFSFLHILRQTMAEFTLNLQRNLKRNYFQSFQQQNLQPMTSFKNPRYDSSVSSSSQIQIETNHPPVRTSTSRISPIIDQFIPVEHDQSDQQSRISDLMFSDDQQSIEYVENLLKRKEMINCFSQSNIPPLISIIEEDRNDTPIILKEHKSEPIQYDEPNYPIENTHMRLLNGSTRTKKSSSPLSRKKTSSPSDENTNIKPTRMSTRQKSIKIEPVTELPLTFETKPVILSSNEISNQWLTHTIFYRCHACSHEEFFVVLSRECINLHISSHHANMQENFKQRLSNFLTRKGRALKIFQHYFKWQQPWSDKQIEQIFKLATK